MIFWFSGTGNSKYCADKIALATKDKVCSINEMMRTQIREVDLSGQKQLGIVCPTYDFDLAYAVGEFLAQLDIRNVSEDCYVFAVITCGKSSGSAENTLREILKAKGIALQAAFQVEMPDNYIPMFPLVSKEEQTHMLLLAEKKLESIVPKIQNREAAVIQTQQMPLPMRFLIRKIAIPRQRKATKNFHVDDTCIGCGLCTRICPKNLIRIENGKPVWTKDDCACCLGCMHRCPKQAIQYGKKTAKTGRYTNPKVTF